jgi:transcriptional regulator with XRE-family HTH domain
MKLSELKAKTLADPQAKARYDALAPIYAIINALLDARRKAKMTQAQVAERMGTKQSAVARMEAGHGNMTLDSIRKYAEATGCVVKVELVAAGPDAPSEKDDNYAEVRVAA